MNTLSHLANIQKFFQTGSTRSFEFRRQQLINFKLALYKYEERIYEALFTDLKKNKEEAWVTEIGFTISEINNTLRNLKRWMKPESKSTNLLNFPGKSYVLNDPLGVVLIIGPWNYPFQLLLTPLIGAIASGNCVVLKPSEFAPASAAVIKELIKEVFSAEYIFLVEGEGHVVIPEMMNNFRFDHVFYTGSTLVGKIIYQMAAQQLVPVTLELGGKSPCIIEQDANLYVTARRIAMTKFSNAGQMCVAPDYLLVHENVKNTFVEELKHAVESFYTEESVRDYGYGKIVNEKQFNRLKSYLKEGKIVFGGGSDASTLFIEPTLLTEVSMQSKVMQEEIFGPLLPMITWKNDDEVYATIEQNKDPLALYVFTSDDRKAEKWINTIAFGGGCINNASWHLTNDQLPFGGIGNSGMGRYHGKYSFETFSHKKAIMKTSTWFDPAFKYPPFKGKLKWLKKIMK